MADDKVRAGVLHRARFEPLAATHIHRDAITPLKRTELGDIPLAWDVLTVGDAFEIRNHLRLPLSQAVRQRMTGDYPYYGPTSIQGWINEYRVEGEHALIGEDGDHFLKWREQPMTLLVKGKFNVNNHAHIVRGTKNRTAWFYWFFKNRDICTYLTRQGASRYKLTKSALEQLPCIVPPPPEQRAIAEALSDADALLGALDRLIAKKRDLKQAAAQELLIGKTRLPGFRTPWLRRKFGNVVSPRTSRVDPRTIGIQEFCVELEHIEPQSGRLLGSIPTHAQSSLKSVFHSGDVLFGKLRAYLRKYWLATRSGVCSTEFWALMSKEGEMIPVYLAQIVRTDAFIECASNAYGTHMPRSDWNVVKNYEVNLPLVDEQFAIATVLSDMDAELAALELRRDKTLALKQGMMAQLLTGRIRLV